MIRTKGAVWAALLFLPFSAGCIVVPYPISAEVDDHQTASLDGIRMVEVDTRNGAIEVTCVPGRTEADVQATKFSRGMSEDDARDHAEDIEIETAPDSGRPDVLRIAARMPVLDPSRCPGASLRIALPPELALNLTTRNGRVSAVGAKNGVEISTRNGPIVLEKIAGDVSGRTSNGTVKANDIDGNVDLTTSNGWMVLERIGRDNVKVRTSNGSIRVIDARGAVTVRTGNGAIDLRVASLTDPPQVHAETSNGGVSVELPSDVSAKLTLRTSNGRVRADLESAKVRDFEGRESRLSATLNDGAGSVDVSTSNGSITVKTTRPASTQPAGIQSASALR